MIRVLFVLVLVLVYLVPIFSWAGPTADCARGPIHQNAEFMADVVCNGVKKKVVAPPANGWFGMCGFGGREGFSTSWEDLKSFGRFIGVTVPTYLYEKGKGAVVAAYEGVVNFFSGDDPAKSVQTQARQDAQASRTVLQELAAKWEAAKLLVSEYTKSLDQNAALVGSTLSCLPWDWKARYICQFIQQVAMNSVTLGGIAKATNKSAAVASAVAKFNSDTKIISELRKLPLTDRLAAGAEALRQTSGMRVFMRTGDANVMVRNDAITGEARYFLEKYATVGGKRVKETVEVVRDAKTGAFDANFPAGAELARMVARSSDQKFLVFGDVMDLGKTNYFKGGTQAGDLYLERLAGAMRSSMREGDMLFKNGGDELVVILNTSDPKAVMDFQQRVHRAVSQDSQLQNLFRENRVARAQAVPRGRAPTPGEVETLQDAARVRPGIAMGAARIKSSDSSPWSNALLDAERQAGQVKNQVKVDRGVSGLEAKYGSTLTPTTSRPQMNAPIPVYKPVE